MKHHISLSAFLLTLSLHIFKLDAKLKRPCLIFNGLSKWFWCYTTIIIFFSFLSSSPPTLWMANLSFHTQTISSTLNPVHTCRHQKAQKLSSFTQKHERSETPKKKRKKKRTRKRPKYFHLRFNHHYPLHFSAKSIKGIFVPMQKKATLSFRCLTLNPQKKLNIKIKRKKKFKAHEQAKSKIQRSRAVGAHVPTPYPCSEDKAFVNGTQNIFKDSITFWLKI